MIIAAIAAISLSACLFSKKEEAPMDEGMHMEEGMDGHEGHGDMPPAHEDEMAPEQEEPME